MRRWSSGGELASVVSGVEWTTVVGAVTVGNVAGGFPVRKDNSGYGGAYCLRIQPISGAFSFVAQQFAYRDEDGPFYARVCMNINVLPSTKSTIVAFSSRGSIVQLWLWIDNLGQFGMDDPSGNIFTIPNPGPIQRWAGLQIAFWRNVAVGANVVAFQGIGDTGESEGPLQSYGRPLSSTGVSSITAGGNLLLEAASGLDVYLDDMCLNDSAIDPNDPTLRAQTAWPSNEHIVHLPVNAAGDMTWAGTQGVDYETRPTPSLAPYTMLDDVPTPDDATTYIQFLTKSAGPTSAPVLDFNIADATAIPAHARINLLQIGARVAAGM